VRGELRQVPRIDFVVRAGADIATEALDRLLLDHIVRFKRPHYRLVEALPKNNSSKGSQG
jgi:hypothetical protein